MKVTAANGDVRSVKVGGRKGHRFKISHDERIMNQDEVVEPQHDPFTNGLWLRTKGSQPVHPPLSADDFTIDALDAPRPEASQMLSFRQLRTILSRHGTAFRSQVSKLNELSLRRLQEIAEELPEEQALTVAQKAVLDGLLGSHRPGGRRRPTTTTCAARGTAASPPPARDLMPVWKLAALSARGGVVLGLGHRLRDLGVGRSAKATRTAG